MSRAATSSPPKARRRTGPIADLSTLRTPEMPHRRPVNYLHRLSPIPHSDRVEGLTLRGECGVRYSAGYPGEGNMSGGPTARWAKLVMVLVGAVALVGVSVSASY